MLPVSGQFHADRAKRPPERIPDGNARASLLLRRDPQEKGHPAVAMVDDDDAVEAAERAGKTDRAGRGRDDR
jgi:hypothetical protein